MTKTASSKPLIAVYVTKNYVTDTRKPQTNQVNRQKVDIAINYIR